MGNSLNDVLRAIKVDILRIFYQSGTGHLASALSCADIITALYFYKLSKEDRIILSKGHGAGALYVALSHKGIIPRSELGTFYDYNSKLLALASPTVPGIEIPTGSLGQGIGFAAGVALAYMMDSKDALVYCIIGDGEMQEGSVWETALFAGNHGLKNLVVILDNNEIQASGRTDTIAPVAPICEKWKAFGFESHEIDGHNLTEITAMIDNVKNMSSDMPKFICANTVKGHGISLIADRPDCHMKNPKGDEWQKVCDEFGISIEELKRL